MRFALRLRWALSNIFDCGLPMDRDLWIAPAEIRDGPQRQARTGAWLRMVHTDGASLAKPGVEAFRQPGAHATGCATPVRALALPAP